MPAWSTQIANEIIKAAAGDGRAFNQMKLQELVYIAHGWCLAMCGMPLTGDRPEAFAYGPEYRRLADALARYGLEPVCQEIVLPDFLSESDLDRGELDLIERVYRQYGDLDVSKLASLTRAATAPWAQVFDGGKGIGRDISHQLIKAQFAELMAKHA